MIGDNITITSPCPPKRGGFYRRGQLDREQLASSHPMKQKMPRSSTIFPNSSHGFCKKS